MENMNCLPILGRREICRASRFYGVRDVTISDGNIGSVAGTALLTPSAEA